MNSSSHTMASHAKLRDLFEQRSRVLSTRCALISIAGGLVVLIGWMTDEPVLKSLVPGFVTMKVNAAICFVLAGSSLWLLREDGPIWNAWLGLALAAAVATIGALTIGEILFHVDLGIDQWFFPEYDAVQTDRPGRMSPAVAVGFILLATGLYAHSKKRTQSSQALAALVLVIAVLSLVGYLYGATSFYRVQQYTAMSLPAALFLLSLGVGLLIARPNFGVARLLTDPTPLGEQLRALLLAMLAVPLFGGMIIEKSVLAGWFEADFAFALLAVLMMLALVLVVFSMGARLSRAEQKRWEDQLLIADSESRYRTMFNNAFIGMAQVSSKGRFLKVNDKLCTMLGYSRDELRKLNFQDITHSDDLPAVLENVKALSQGDISNYRLEKRYLKKDGGIVWVDLQVAAERDLNGDVSYFIKSILDVTARKLQETQLRELAEVVENTQDFVGICNLDFRMTYVNAAGCRMVGFDSSDDLLDRDMMSLFWPEDLDRIKAEAIHSLTQTGRWQGEVRFKNFKTAEPVHTFWNVAAIRDAKGESIAYATVSPDLNQLKIAETQLAEANRDKDRFLTLLGHELRNPLGALRSALAALEENPTEEQDRAMRAIMERQVIQITALVDDLVDLARLQSHRLTVDLQPSDVADFLRFVVRERQLEASTLGISLTEKIADHAVLVAIDHTRLRQVVHNLLTNAFRAAPQGQITVELEVDDEWVQIKIRDDGIGISGDSLNRIFKPFEQASDSPTEQSGLGLGLPLASELVERHGGTLKAYSEGKGLGAEFVVKLPRQKLDLQSSCQKAISPEVRQCIVLIEDQGMPPMA